MIKPKSPNCAKCPTRGCEPQIDASETPLFDKVPNYCPMKTMSGSIQKGLTEYEKADTLEFARQASIQEFECYEQTPEGRRTKNPRILELIEFSKKCGYQRLGLAFCTGLRAEARTLTEILENHGFEVVSVQCKVGSTPKEKIGIKPEQKIGGPTKWESMCNPIVQAEIMNAEKVDFAIMLGLCLGHDTLFIKHCRVPMTVIAVKDRVTGHNPLAALYTINSYYKRLATKSD